jgi:D-arabinono-1,4-lactone oxidase
MSVLGIGKKNFLFSNWAGIHSCKPSLFFQPSTLDEIVELVKLAKQDGKTLLTVGSGHSPSDLVMTNDWLVNLDNYNEVLDIKRHSSGLYADVTVQAGIRLFQLHEALAKQGLAMQNLGSISEQSVAGVISTGTHGASPYHGLISQQFVDLTIVNGKGEVVFCNSGTNQDLFRAAMLSLGKVGIIVKATIRVIPSFNVKSSEEVINFDTLLEKWETLWISSEFIRVWWYPYAKKCVLWRGHKTEDPVTEPRLSWWGTKFGRLFYEALLWVAVNIYPPFTPYIEKFVFNRQFGKVETVGDGAINVGGSVEALNMDCLFSQFVNEWAAPLNNGPEILRSLEHSINVASANHDFYVHVPIEIRCSNTTGTNDPSSIPDFEDRTTLSAGPIRGNNLRPYLDNTPTLNYVPLSDVTNSQLTLYINATMYRPFRTNSPIGKWYKIFEETMGAAGGKPHWAKNFIGSAEWADGETKTEGKYYDGEMRGFAAKNREWFGKDLEEFKRVRAEQDPDDVFMSSKQWFVKNGLI